MPLEISGKGSGFLAAVTLPEAMTSNQASDIRTEIGAQQVESSFELEAMASRTPFFGCECNILSVNSLAIGFGCLRIFHLE